MIIYNGRTGGLGRFLAGAADSAGHAAHALTARLEDDGGLVSELEAIEPVGPVTFIHLAARVSVPACEADPEAAHRVNVHQAHSTVSRVIDWAGRRGITLRVIYVSSGHVYAEAPPGTRLDEEAPTGPRSVYARTKLEAERELHSLCEAHAVDITVARVFGLIAPLQAPHYVLPSLISRVRSRRLDQVPGLDYSRDYLDARDVCDDLLLLATSVQPGWARIVNVCSGTPITIRELLSAVARAADPEAAARLMETATAAPGRLDDITWLVGDPSRFGILTGHAPQRIALSTTVAEAVAAMHTPGLAE